MMSLRDFFILYLACGAPFGVHYFLHCRKNVSPLILWLKSFLTVVVWIPYAFKFLHEFVTRKFPPAKKFNNFPVDSERAKKLARVENNFSNLLAEGSARGTHIFEFRETFARYVGLTAACQTASQNGKPTGSEKEVFRLAGRQNQRLGARCLHRRNVLKLRRHQKHAGEDLLALLVSLNLPIERREMLRALAGELFTLLEDAGTLNLLGEVFAAAAQTETDFAVNSWEKNLWKPVKTTYLPASPKPLSLQLSAAATRKRD